MFERKDATVVVLVARLLARFIVGRASEPRRPPLRSRFTSADHEVDEGYFSLGNSATLVVKPGTDFYRFLANRRGRQIRVTLTEAGRAEPPRLSR